MAHADMVDYGRSLLTTDDVEPGVAHMIPFICVEACMAEGTKLVTLFDPSSRGAAAAGAAKPDHSEPGHVEPVPGEIITQRARSKSTRDAKAFPVDVLNTGGCAIQVRSHAHFFERETARSVLTAPPP